MDVPGAQICSSYTPRAANSRLFGLDGVLPASPADPGQGSAPHLGEAESTVIHRKFPSMGALAGEKGSST
jgi:hypothetical protein